MSTSIESSEAIEKIPTKRQCQWIWILGTLTVLVPLFMLVDDKILTVISYFGTQGLWTIIQTLLKQHS